MCIAVGVVIVPLVKEVYGTWEKRRQRELMVEQCLHWYPPRSVSHTGLTDLKVLGDGDEYEPWRPRDDQMDAALVARRLLLLVAPKGYRTQGAFEAVRRAYPGALLVRPVDGKRLRQLLELDPPWQPEAPKRAPWVLWLDNLAEFLPDGLDAAALKRLLDRPAKLAQVVVVGTMSHAELVAVLRNPSFGNDVVGEITSRGGLVEVAPGVGTRQRARVRRRCKGGTAQDWRRTRHGRGVVEAAVDWMRCGIEEPIAADALEKLSAAYLGTGYRSDDWFTRALEWAGGIDPYTTGTSS